MEDNLKALGFVRGRNDEGQAQHFSWRMPVGAEATVVVDLLCDASPGEGGDVVGLANERRLSALRIPGAHLVTRDFVPVELTAELLGERGVATETVRVAGVVAFVVLKALAYEDRTEEKDAYDIVYTLMHYGAGPDDVAAAVARRQHEWPDEPLLLQAIDVLRRRFATDERTSGHRKDGPRSCARFLADPARTELAARRQRDAVAVVERLLAQLDALARDAGRSTQS